MKTTRQYYYMDRKGTLRCRAVQEPRRRKRARLKSPTKLGGLLAVLAVSGGVAALLLGNWSAPVSQVARVEVAAVPLSILAQGDESVSAEDIGKALWADFNETVAEAVETVAEMPEEESATAEAPVEEAPAVETAAEMPEEENTTAEEPEEPAAAEEPAVETPDDGETPDEAAAEFLEEAAGEAAPAQAVAAQAEDAAQPDEAAMFLEDEEPATATEDAAQPNEAAMFLEDEEPATVTEAAAPVGAVALEVPEDERISVRTIPEAKPPEAE